MYYSRPFKILSRHRITWDYYDRHVHREAFVGPRRYDEQPRFFRLTSVRAMNLRALRSLEVSWYIRNARFRPDISLFLLAVRADSNMTEYENNRVVAPVVLPVVQRNVPCSNLFYICMFLKKDYKDLLYKINFYTPDSVIQIYLI